MPLRVHVHAAIWVDGRVAVHRRVQHDREHVTLPGGRVKDRETVVDALQREVGEEIDRDIEVGELLLAGEVNATSRQDVVLVFAARLRPPAAIGSLDLVDPAGPEAAAVLPPVLDWLPAPGAPEREHPIWLGNLYGA